MGDGFSRGLLPWMGQGQMIDKRITVLEADPRLQVPLDGLGSHRADLRELRACQDKLRHVAWAWRAGLLRTELSPDGDDLRPWLDRLGAAGAPMDGWHSARFAKEKL